MPIQLRSYIILLMELWCAEPQLGAWQARWVLSQAPRTPFDHVNAAAVR